MKQNYTSEDFHHFVGRSLANDQLRFDLLLQIIKSGWITPPPHRKNELFEIELRPIDIFRQYELLNPKVVCFCDIPSSELNLHIQKYGNFGLSFNKNFLLKKGATPVFYLPQQAVRNFNILEGEHEIDFSQEDPYEAHAEYIRENGETIGLPLNESFNEWYKRFFHIHKYMRSKSSESIESKEHKNFFEVTEPLIMDFIPYVLSLVKTFDATLKENNPENYYMEREWRILGSLNFEIKDIEKIFLPKDFSALLRKELPEFSGEIIFSEKI